MHFEVKGDDIPQALLEMIADITDHARLKLADLLVDEAAGVITLPITRFPLIKRRKVLWSIYDIHSPILATIVLRNGICCELENHFEEGAPDEVMLLFGLRIEGKEIFACSVQETHGTSLFSIRATVSEIELEIIDR